MADAGLPDYESDTSSEVSESEVLRPVETFIYEDGASPVRLPVSPTRDPTQRVTLGELTPRTLAGRTRASTRAARTPARTPVVPRPEFPRERRRPGLSSDKIGQLFIVVLDNGHQYNAVDVRFVLWYHCRTVLQSDSIAIAYNAVFRPAAAPMSGEEVDVIIRTIKHRWPTMSKELQMGHFAVPNAWGWHPCDHHLDCSVTAAAGRKSVMRPSKTKVAGIKMIREILTTVWQGSWDELLLCSRNHEASEEVSESELGIATPRGSRADGGYPSSSATRRHYQSQWPIALIGGPKVLYHFTKVTLRVVLALYLLEEWFKPLPILQVEDARFVLRVPPLGWVSCICLVAGASRLLDLVFHVLRAEVLMFQDVHRPPPLSLAQKIQWSILGSGAAVTLLEWRGSRSSNIHFMAWFNPNNPRPSS